MPCDKIQSITGGAGLALGFVLQNRKRLATQKFGLEVAPSAPRRRQAQGVR
jgi:hypothetical protein